MFDFDALMTGTSRQTANVGALFICFMLLAVPIGTAATTGEPQKIPNPHQGPYGPALQLIELSESDLADAEVSVEACTEILGDGQSKLDNTDDTCNYFSEDFSGSLSKWKFVTTAISKKVVGGRLELTSKTGNWGAAYTNFDPTDFFYFQTDLNAITNNLWAGIYPHNGDSIGIVNIGSYSFLGIGAAVMNDGRVGFLGYEVDDYKYYILYPKNYGTVTKLGIACQSGRFSLLVNGKEVRKLSAKMPSVPDIDEVSLLVAGVSTKATFDNLCASNKDLNCLQSVSPTNASYGVSGGNGSISINAASTCAWTAVSDSSFLRITSGSSGTGSGTVNYTVDPSTAQYPRSGTVQISGQQCKIAQAGTSCTSVSISPASASFSSNGGTGSVVVNGSSDCDWTAASNASFLSITSGSSGTGSGTVEYSVSANTGNDSRSGTLTVAGQTVTITQEPKAGNFDGTWTGTTDENRPIRIVVVGNKVTSISVDVAVMGPSCGCLTTLVNKGSTALSGSTFRINVSSSSGVYYTTTINGSFTQNRTGSGKVDGFSWSGILCSGCFVIGNGYESSHNFTIRKQ